MTIPQGYAPLDGSERGRPAHHTLLGPVDGNHEIGITLLVRQRPDGSPLPDLDHWQSTPPQRRRYPSRDEFINAYGAAQSDLDAVAAFATAQGLTVVESHAGRLTVTLTGTVARLNQAFGIELNHYQAPQPSARPSARASAAATSPAPAPAPAMQTYHGYEGPVHLPTDLVGIVVAVFGLDNRSLGNAGGSSGDPMNAQQLAVPTVAGYYHFPNTGAADQTIGVIAASDPPTATSPRLSGYLANDILNLYFPNLSDANYRKTPVLHDVDLTVGTNHYTNNTGSVTQSNGFALEVTQDICTSATVAQGATVNVYFTELTEQGLVVCLNRILMPETESQPTVVTCSFYFDASDGVLGSADASTMSTLFQRLATLGINVFVISNDEGSNDGDTDGKTHVNYPGSDPWVTSVGGTVIGNVKSGPPVTFDEWVWSNVGSPSAVGNVRGASGGGASAIFPVPPYQSAAGITQITDSDNNTTTNKRCIPDVAGMVAYGGANFSSPEDWFYINGVKSNFVGTSCSTPLFAGLAAVLRSALGIELGFLNSTLYQLGLSACNDVTFGNNDPADGSNAPYYTAGLGWDPCTGWGSIDGTRLLNGMASQMYAPSYYFQVEKSTYGLDEVKVNEDVATGISTYAGALSLVVEGFTPNAVEAAALTLTVTSPLAGVKVTVGPAAPELPLQTSTPQRIFFPCSVAFSKQAINPVPQGVFPAPNTAPALVTLQASNIVIGSFSSSASTELELVAGADPGFVNFDPKQDNAWYLSEDLRVFTVTPGVNAAPIAGVAWPGTNTASFDTPSAFTYLQNLLRTLNANSSYNSGASDPFALLPDQSSALTGDSSVTPFSIDPAHPLGPDTFPNYNFAIARVRLNGAPAMSTSTNVRVFFRLFVTQSSDSDYQPALTYPSTPDGAGLPGAPLVGIGNVTVPFFATGNYQTNADFSVNVDYPGSGTSPNSFPITVPASGTAWAYFGCYLNVYPTANTIGGEAVQSMLTGSHHCVVAQIAFDDAPIPTSGGMSVSPANSDKLAQRNLQITLSDNPGPASTHRIPQTFDLRPSPAPATIRGNLLDYPDELMIDWGDTPVGSVASIYWPQVHASEVLALATQFYSTHQLAMSDPHTVQCKVPRGITFVPIPTGSGQNFAGLFTVDLPRSVLTGQVFTIVVRRIATRRALERSPIDTARRTAAAGSGRGNIMVNWRYVVGSFAVRIPVTTAKPMLPLEETTLAIMKWRLQQIPRDGRWHPVLQRYIGYLAGRVDGLGGNSNAIMPSPLGLPPAPVAGAPGHEHTGKVTGVLYDRFGDFEGFLLLTETGVERFYHSREVRIETLVRFAWADRVVISVLTKAGDLHSPVSIVLRRAPPPPRIRQ